MTGWVAIALGRDVPAGATRGVVVDGGEIVLWRGVDGAIHAWEDRCPHRGMRLSFGFVRENALNCLYHGWQYGAGAQCLKIPAHPDLNVPPTIRANAYAARESGGLVWMNRDAAAADGPPALPEHGVPVASLALGAGAAAVRAAIGRAKLPAGLHLESHATGSGRAMLHGVATAGGDAAALWAWLKAFRNAVEEEMAA